MDQIAEDLIEAATYAGEFNDDFWNADSYNLDEYYYYDIDWGADEYFNSGYNRVQVLPYDYFMGKYISGLLENGCSFCICIE